MASEYGAGAYGLGLYGVGEVTVVVSTAGGGGRVRPSDFTLTLYDSAALGGIPLVVGIDPQITALSWSTGVFGGWTSCQVGVTSPNQRGQYGVSRGYMSRPIAVKPFATAILRHGQRVVFMGRVVEIVMYEGDIRGVTIAGWGLMPQGAPWYSTSATADTTAGVLTKVQPTCAPFLRLGNSDVFTDPGNAHTLAEFDGMTWQGIVEQLANEAGYMYLYYEAGVEFRAKTAPATPDYRISLNGVETTQNYRNVAGAGRVRYDLAGVETTYPATSSAPLSESAFADLYGESIEALVSADQLTTAGATNFLTTYIANHIDPETAVTLDPFTTLARPGGAPALGAFVRAGQWVKVADQPPLLILGTQHNALTGQTQATIGAIPPHSWLTTIVNVQQPIQRIVAGLAPGPAGGKRK